MCDNMALVKRRHVKKTEYRAIHIFIEKNPGLSIDDCIQLLNNFPQIEEATLKSILENACISRTCMQHGHVEANGRKFLNIYEARCSSRGTEHEKKCILLNIARSEGVDPVPMCRSLLKAKYGFLQKTTLNSWLKEPQLIDDTQLSLNVAQCINCDPHNGPMVDMRRRLVGEEFETKLKECAKGAGMSFYDEDDLRRLGYEKTPDIKLTSKVEYKGTEIHWIESKANFGDFKMHKRNAKMQLECYCNRFGNGIVIYWFGYVEGVESMQENGTGITVLNDFPAKEDIQVFN